MDSIPPATMISEEPEIKRSLANIAAFIPEPHILLIVVQPAASGRPAPSEAWRAGAWPCPAGRTQPMSTSCTSSGRILARSTAARIAAAPSSGAAKPFSSPWKAPIGVRAAETMTIGSVCIGLPLEVVRSHQLLRALHHLFRKGNRLARLGVHRYAGQHANRRDFLGLRIAHFMHEARDLVPDLKERRAHGDGVAGEELALVGDVLLHGRHAALVLL